MGGDYSYPAEVIRARRQEREELKAALAAAEAQVAALSQNEWGLTEALDIARASSPDDIRAQGWSVAVHNDYRQNGMPHTFWLFTKDGRAVKGEGRTDAEALNFVRAQLGR